ncbi:DUF4230 domain-containing protein [Francisella philomiragia]|uniref:DUF4230 domain-containing protein n=1 Tax=Francisella philomiragia TaxID=28110 RepID=UPI0019049E8D|nr:DUF4230 domain-containing protein [Francisella philomiragia]MBK2267852.1 DUF4230 domain-containing protein [Francisella philomiragia]MBK2279438.1 DUF4230 domain-containing protein [Francisella philomiragia]MBK2287292.1 DUF4230 domain-containing protein [Francisella philomiragia]MBK2289270.1 DUF4230 domain-containing protein [Francisella philomiragia]MBK2290988.1 DUF4230 domain-containing protein [Francisella philomiragia]
MSKFLKYFLIIAILIITVSLITSKKDTEIVPTVVSVQKIGELSTLKVTVSGNSLYVSDNGTLVENTAKYSYKASAILSTNIDESDIKIDAKDKTITLKVKPPKVTSVTIDFDKTKQLSRQAYTFKILPRLGVINTDPDNHLANIAYKEVQKLTDNVASSQEHIEEAKNKFVSLMNKQYQPLGWKVVVDWVG